MARSLKPGNATRTLCDAHGHDGPVRDLVLNLVEGLLADVGADLPVNLEIVASYVGATVEYLPVEGDGSIRWDASLGRYVITISTLQHPARARFSLAHEVIHTFFSEATNDRSARSHAETAMFDEKDEEEFLCDIGAAHLLVPTAHLNTHLPPRPTITDVKQIATACNASIEATARRVVEHSGMRGSVVVLEPFLKPVEVRALERHQTAPALPGLEPAAPSAKLRVRYSSNQGLPFIPPAKSVDDDCPLRDAAEDDCAEAIFFIGNTGLLPRELAVSAEFLPFDRNGDWVRRVIALVFDSEDWTRAS